jgi:hypothetical protein
MGSAVNISLLGFLLTVGESVCNDSMLLGFKLTDGESVCSILAFVGALVDKALRWLGVKMTVGNKGIFV